MKIREVYCKHVDIYDVIKFDFSFECEDEFDGFEMVRVRLCELCFAMLKGNLLQLVLNEAASIAARNLSPPYEMQ